MKGQTVVLKADRNLFSQMHLVAESRSVNMNDALSHRIGSLSWAPANADGSRLGSLPWAPANADGSRLGSLPWAPANADGS